jgi:6-phosphofructokinase 1
MNAAIRAVAKVAASKGVETTGIENGYEGLMEGRHRPLTHSVDGEMLPVPELELIGQLGGTVLGSARCDEFRSPEGRAKAASHLEGQDALIVIGGNGSLAGARLLAEESGVPVIGIPASIDNDIGCTTTAIGVDTALNTIIEACDRIADTARAHRRAFVVEVMGRDCGYLAMAAAVATAADAVLYREQGRDREALIASVEKVIREGFGRRGKRRILIIKSEGVRLATGDLVDEIRDRVLPSLPGVSIRATILGHVVRGGAPSYRDRMIAGRLGFAALAALESGATSEMVAWQPGETGTRTADPLVRRFPLGEVLQETDALLDGTSPLTQRRVRMMQAIECVLPL